MLSSLPNATQAEFWISRAQQAKSQGNLQVNFVPCPNSSVKAKDTKGGGAFSGWPSIQNKVCMQDAQMLLKEAMERDVQPAREIVR